MSIQSFQLTELEAKARANALKRVAELFQKPEQLDKIDLIKSRFLNQKTATEAQLRMALHSQLDGSKTGLDKLDTALSEAQNCKNRIFQLGAALTGLVGLSVDLHELKNISIKYSQLAAATENMSYVVKVPEAMEQAKAYIEADNILDAHKIVQELEGIRDELMAEVYRQKSPEDLETLRTYFKGLEELNSQFREKISLLGSTLTNAVVTQNVFVQNCVRVIDREERADLIWQKRLEKSPFMPDGRPKQWKKLLFDKIAQTIQNKVFGSALDSDTDKNKLVRHNEAIRQHTLTDLKIAKNICPTYFPPDYGIYDRFVEMYHDAIGMHVESLVLEGLTDTQIVQLLGWINSYHSEEFMKNPFMNIDFSRLNIKYPINLLPEDKLDALRQQYVSKTVERLRGWLTKALNKVSSDWQGTTPPSTDGLSVYGTDLPFLIMTPVRELFGEGNLLRYLGNAVRERFLIQCLDQMAQFIGEYDYELKQYRLAYLADRSRFRYYFEYILANANTALVIAKSFTDAIMQELAQDAQLKGRLSARLNHLKVEYENVAKKCLDYSAEVIFLDIGNVLAVVMTQQWLSPTDMTTQYLTGTLDDYDETLKHLNPASYEELAEKLAEQMLIKYIKVLMTGPPSSAGRRCNFSTDAERRQAGEKILHDGQGLRKFFEENMNVKKEITASYEALTAIGNLFLTTDVSMLSLDIVNMQRQFPDLRPEQLYVLLLARGDLKPNQAKEMASDYQYGRDAGTVTTSGTGIFTKLAMEG